MLESLFCSGEDNQVLNNFKDSFLEKYIMNQNKYKPIYKGSLLNLIQNQNLVKFCFQEKNLKENDRERLTK